MRSARATNLRRSISALGPAPGPALVSGFCANSGWLAATAAKDSPARRKLRREQDFSAFGGVLSAEELRFSFPEPAIASETDAYSEAELTLVNSVSACGCGRCDLVITPETLDGAVTVQLQVGDVGSRIIEVRRVGQIEGLRS